MNESLLINGTIFGKFIGRKMCFIFFANVSVTFLIVRRNERDMIKMYFGLHVKYRLFLFYFDETWIFSTYFRKILKYQIS